MVVMYDVHGRVRVKKVFRSKQTICPIMLWRLTINQSLRCYAGRL